MRTFRRSMMVTEMEDYARKLQLADLLRGPVTGRAIRELRLSAGSKVLDAGCGIGSHLPLLAEQVGQSGHVTGLDISTEMISRSRKRVAECGLEDRVSLTQGNVKDLPFKNSEFDCALSVDCVGYPYSPDPVTLLRSLARIVRPGGTVAIMGWSYQQLLPGYPVLEATLNTASSLVAPSGAAISPETHFLCAPGWFQEADFIATSSRSYAGDICAPLADEEKEAVQAFFEMLWKGTRPAISDSEWQLFQHISHPGSKEFILDKPYYYGFFVYVCFSGTVPLK